MANQKKPFHEVLSERLCASLPNEIVTGSMTSAKTAEVKTILDIMFKGKMPAAVAHQISADHANLPRLLAEAGEGYLSSFAEKVLNDLHGREDEKKGEGEPLGVAFGWALSNLVSEK